MKKILSILLSCLMMFSLFTPAFAATAKKDSVNLAEDFFGNVHNTAISLIEINKLTNSLLKKMEPVIMDMLLSSENWEKATKFILDKFTSAFDNLIKPEKPDIPEKPENPDIDNPDIDNPDIDNPGENPSKPDPDINPPVNPDQPDVPTENPGLPEIDQSIKFVSFNDFINIIKKYFVINMADIDARSQAIVDSAEYQYTVMKDGKKTVYIFVNIEDNTQLLNVNLLRETVKKLYEKQNIEYSADADILMSYQHLAGELALHAIMYAVSYEYVQITGKTEGRMYDYWQKAREACLNIDEDRLPNEVFKIVGYYITGVFLINYYNIYKAISNLKSF